MSRIDLGYTSYPSWCINKQGVPQGCILGPLIFFIT